ncbi:hypothetical protein [Acidisoma sp. C75]
MVSPSYLTEKPGSGPRAAHAFLTQRVMPVATDWATQVERGCHEAGEQARRHPALATLLALGLGMLGGRMGRARRPAPHPRSARQRRRA